MTAYQTFLKDCNCKHSGILFRDNVACCRWCLKPYGKGGMINYEDESFQPKIKPTEENKDVFTWDDRAASAFKETGLTIEDFKTYWHKCKHCGAWTTQPDERCYLNLISKQPSNTDTKKERITISGLGSTWENGTERLFFTSNVFIPTQKWGLIKQAIEAILNDESPLGNYEDTMKQFSVMFYTQQELDKAREDAFNAGRGRYVNQQNGETYYDYLTLESYLSSIKEKQ